MEKIVKKFFSTDKIVSHYSKPRLSVAEIKLFKKYLKKGKVLDLCCGAGRVAIQLAKMGFDVTGVDNNLKMIKAANNMKRKHNVKNIKFICDDASRKKFKKEQFDYVLAMDNSLEYIVSRIKREILFENVYKSLKKDGLFITSFNSCFYPIKIPIRIFINNLIYIVNHVIFSRNYQLGLNDIILRIKINKEDLIYFSHLFFPWEIKKIGEKAGFKSFEIVPFNILDQRKNRFRNLKIYQHLKSFLYCYLVMFK
jgi:SAM-dependent methyltransferase